MNLWVQLWQVLHEEKTRLRLEQFGCDVAHVHDHSQGKEVPEPR